MTPVIVGVVAGVAVLTIVSIAVGLACMSQKKKDRTEEYHVIDDESQRGSIGGIVNPAGKFDYDLPPGRPGNSKV